MTWQNSPLAKHMHRQKSTVYEQHHTASLAKIEQLWPTACPPVDVATSMCAFGRDFAMPNGGHSDNRCPAPAADGSLHGCSQRHVTWLQQAVKRTGTKKEDVNPKNAVPSGSTHVTHSKEPCPCRTPMSIHVRVRAAT